MSERLRREIQFEPAYDKRTEGYGWHGAEITFVLTGVKGAVTFKIFTNWHLPSVNLPARPPMGADFGRHTHRPQYDGESDGRADCHYLDGKPCYYDGSGLDAQELLKLLISEGPEPVWARMTERYARLIGP